MPKAKKKAVDDTPPAPQVGDKVRPGKSEMVYEISRVYHDGNEVDLHVPRFNLQRFRVRVDNLTFVERQPPVRTSNPFTEAESVLDTEEIMERIATVQRKNLERLGGDIDILKTYLKTQGAPNTTIEALEGLTVEQHKAWKVAIGKIKKELK